MSNTFSCDTKYCGFVFETKSELKKHKIEHVDPSKLFRCTQCPFSSMYSNNFKIHMNTHLRIKPLTCPDVFKVTVSSTSGDSSQPSVVEKPCNYRTNCSSGLIKHRAKYHGYVTDPKRSIARRGVPKETSSNGHSLPVSQTQGNSNSNLPSHDPRNPFAPLHAGKISHKKRRSISDPRYHGENKYIYHNVVSSHNSDSFRTMKNGSMSTYSRSIEYSASDSYNAESEGSHVAVPCEPMELPSLPLILCGGGPEGAPSIHASNEPLSAPTTRTSGRSNAPVANSPSYFESETRRSDASRILAVELIESNSRGVPQNNFTDGSMTLPSVSSPPVLEPALPTTHTYFDGSRITGETDIEYGFGPFLSDFETEFHEDNIFFRGTGREGCLCPEMMVDTGVEGWDKSLLDY